AQHGTRLGGDALRVLEVAGVLEGDAQRERRALWAVRGREQLRDVGNREVETGVFQVRAATCCVGDDRLGAGVVEGGGYGVRHREPLLAAPGVQGERAAAAVEGRDDLVTV